MKRSFEGWMIKMRKDNQHKQQAWHLVLVLWALYVGYIAEDLGDIMVVLLGVGYLLITTIFRWWRTVGKEK